jgi:predicted nucleic acid-binding protein
MKKTAATAESAYADPSALMKLYLHEEGSAAMNAWRARTKGTLPVTHHGRLEVINGIALASHRHKITSEACDDALASFEEDFQQGRYRQADLMWRAALTRATELSRKHSRTTGTRTLDVIHVASALELGLRRFVTFDLRQQDLARIVGLKVIVPLS